jgi:PII-like signaling protein
MDGYLVTFFTQQSRTHDGAPLTDWILEQAQALGVRGATVFPGREGFGHDGRFHSDSLFDMEDTPLQVVMALSPDECDRLFAAIAAHGHRVFYTKSRVEFGFTAEA